MDVLELADLVKRRSIIAIAGDDLLMNILVFKGGNALAYIHGITARASFDLDFSMADEFEDIEILRSAIKRSLHASFEEVSLVPFDVVVEAVPAVISEGNKKFWGGYSIEFKLIGVVEFDKFRDDPQQLQNRSLSIGPNGRSKRFQIDISRHEYCGDRQLVVFEDYRLYVYSPATIVCEKLRAICQQLPEYHAIVNRHRDVPKGRAGDFLDICSILDKFPIKVNSVEFRQLLNRVFAAKRVPLRFLRQIPGTYSTQVSDFERVRATVSSTENLQSFEFYFLRVLELCSQLEPLGDE